MKNWKVYKVETQIYCCIRSKHVGTILSSPQGEGKPRKCVRTEWRVAPLQRRTESLGFSGPGRSQTESTNLRPHRSHARVGLVKIRPVAKELLRTWSSAFTAQQDVHRRQQTWAWRRCFSSCALLGLPSAVSFPASHGLPLGASALPPSFPLARVLGYWILTSGLCFPSQNA